MLIPPRRGLGRRGEIGGMGEGEGASSHELTIVACITVNVSF